MSEPSAIPLELPIIPLKNVVLFPRVAIPLLVQRPKSIGSLDFGLAKDRLAVFVAQKNIYDEVDTKDLFEIGTVGRIFEVHKLPDGSVKIDVEGVARVRIKNYTQENPFLLATVEQLSAFYDQSVETEALTRAIVDQFRQLLEMRNMQNLIPDLINVLHQVKDPFQIIYLITINLNLELKDQQDILEAMDAQAALKKMNAFINREMEILDAEKRVVHETRKNLGKMQKEVFLREQMKSIEKELGIDGQKGDIDTIKQKIEAAKMPKKAETKALKDLPRLATIPSFSPSVG